eukprot:jgi/Chrpa1/19045/Chrysochromulina_OHIO_Genome00025689-RA
MANLPEAEMDRLYAGLAAQVAKHPGSMIVYCSADSYRELKASVLEASGLVLQRSVPVAQNGVFNRLRGKFNTLEMPVVCDPHEIMASTTSPLLSLPDDLLGRCMHLLPLGSLVPSIAALRLVCRSLAEALAAESAIYTALLPCFVSVVLVQPSSPSRRSARLAELSPGETFRREWRGLVQRLEARHHTIACAGQDSKDLTLSMLKARVAHFGERLIDRPSPVYNATLLMEVCRARGAREQTLIALAEHLVLKLGADPSARPHAHAVTPLIIAAARGLPKLAAFLLACGADPRPRGEGRFRLCGQRATVSGILCARGFVRRLYLAEEQSGVLRDERESLLLTHRVLEAH